MKRVLSLLVVLALVLALAPAVFATGESMDDPYILATNGSQTLSVPAEGYIFAQITGSVNLTISGEQWMVPYVTIQIGKFETYELSPKNGMCLLEELADATLLMISNGSEDAIDLTFSTESLDGDTSGTESDPIILADSDLGDRTVTTSSVTYYKWVASGDGTFTLTIDDSNLQYGYEYGIDTSASQSSGLHADDWYPATSDSVSVSTGDEVTFYVGINYETYGSQAEDTVHYNVTFTAGREPEPGSSEDNRKTLSGFPAFIIVPANQTYYYVFEDSANLADSGVSERNFSIYSYDLTGNFNVKYDGKTVDADESGEVSGSFAIAQDGKYYFAVTNNNDDLLTLTVDFEVITQNDENQDENNNDPVNEGKKEESVLSDKTYQIDGQMTYTFDLTLDPSAKTTIFEFVPTETGVYKFETADNVLLGYWGGSRNYTYDSTGKDKTNVLEKEVTSVGQSIMLGVTGEGTCTVKVTRAGDAEEKETEWTVYQNASKPAAYADLQDGDELVKLDVVKNDYTAVLGDDGYYHLDSKDGPILLVDLDDDTYLALADVISGEREDTLKVATYDENGNPTYKGYEFGPALREFVDAANSSGLYPLTKDLAYIIQTTGNTPGFGWFDDDVKGIYLFADADKDPGADAWLFACAYVKAAEPSDNPETGDISIALVSALVLVSGMGVAVLTVSKKKFF